MKKIMQYLLIGVVVVGILVCALIYYEHVTACPNVDVYRKCRNLFE